MNLDNISEADLDRLLYELREWMGAPRLAENTRANGRQIIREWLESLGDKV